MELHLYPKYNVGDIYWYNNPIEKKDQKEMDDENIPFLRGNRPMLIIEISRGMATGILCTSKESDYHQIRMKNSLLKTDQYNWSVINIITFRPSDTLIGSYIGNVSTKNIASNMLGRKYTAGYPSRDVMVPISHQPVNKLVRYNGVLYIVLMTTLNKSYALPLEKVDGVDAREIRVYVENEYYRVNLNKFVEMEFERNEVEILASMDFNEIEDLKYKYLIYRPTYDDKSDEIAKLKSQIHELKSQLAVAESKLESIHSIFNSQVQNSVKLVVKQPKKEEKVVESKPAGYDLDCFKKLERFNMNDNIAQYFTPLRPRKFKDIKSPQDLMDFMSLYKDEKRDANWYMLKSDLRKSINMEIAPLEIVQSFNKNFADLRK